MTKNLETADLITKLILSIFVILLYALDIISGPFAIILVIFSAIVLLLFAVKIIVVLTLRD